MRHSGAVGSGGAGFRCLPIANEGEDEAHRRLMVLTFLISLWLFVPVACATTCWVPGATGSNVNACNAVDGHRDRGMCQQTINGGLPCLSAGDTLIIKAGRYLEAIGTTGVPEGTSESTRTTIEAETPGTVTMRPSGSLRVIEPNASA
jgi:hypothetical protein